MKKLILFLLLLVIASNLFAVRFRFYPGLYVGGNGPTEEGFSFGADLQLGLEFGRFFSNDFVFGIHGNAGIDTGLPNQPNFYFGGITELYWGHEGIKIGVSLGIGKNIGFEDVGDRNLESMYFRLGIPVNFGGRFKTGVYFDFYPGIGTRYGLMLHYGV
jgi:hypothetical protein